MFDNNPEYVEWIKSDAHKWLGKAAKDLLLVNSEESSVEQEALL